MRAEDLPNAIDRDHAVRAEKERSITTIASGPRPVFIHTRQIAAQTREEINAYTNRHCQITK
jgi:hypothetical protein